MPAAADITVTVEGKARARAKLAAARARVHAGDVRALRERPGLPQHGDDQAAGRILEAMTTPGPNVDVVTIPRAELDAMKAERRRLRHALDDEIAR